MFNKPSKIKYKNLAELDSIVLGTINECFKHFNTPMIKLFENDKNLSDIKGKNVIDINDFYGNKYAYFNAVNEFVNSTNIRKSYLFESDDFSSFKAELEMEIKNLLSVNDFVNIRTMNKLVLSTKLFSDIPINIYGFNIKNFNKILDKNKIDKCFIVFYSHSNSSLVFGCHSKVFIYDIKSNKLSDLTKNHKNVEFNNSNIIEFINENYTNDLIIIKQTNITYEAIKDKIIDNVYSDNRYHTKLKQMYKHFTRPITN